MLRVNNVKANISADENRLRELVARKLKIKPEDIITLNIKRRSLDARKKDDIHYVYSFDAGCKKESEILKKHKKSGDVKISDTKEFCFEINASHRIKERPVIIGSGPAGLFCGLFLAEAGYKPIIIERGESIDDRKKTLENFWSGKKLNPESNAQFGEGGAGTFSDGKLNTLVKDKNGIMTRVLKEFVRFGADESILYDAKPHLGTDVLSVIIKNIRNSILSCGGEIRFNTRFSSFEEKPDGNYVYFDNGDYLKTDALILAIGHSARDTIEYLYKTGLKISAKPFAVGFRVEHPQDMINKAAYGENSIANLPVATYKLTAKTTSGRGVYSFCMCPGGYVVNASSEEGRTAINGMSYSARDGKNANSAIIITVTPDDFGGKEPLNGILFQRKLEELAYRAGGGNIPQQLYGDFKNSVISASYGRYESEIKGHAQFANLRGILPDELGKAFIEGMEHFGKIIDGFNRDDAILSAIESRTSSPVRIERDENFTASKKWIYPCGEGAGYAGGITSAAMDGIKTAQAIANRFRP